MARSDFGSIQELPTGLYRGRYRVRGKDYYTPRERTKKAVRAELTRIHAKILEGTWVPPRPRRGGRTKARTGPQFVREYSEKWIEGMKRRGLSPNTIRSYKSIMAAHVLPTIGDERMVDVRAEHFAAIFETMTARAPKTRGNVARCISAMFQHAHADGVIQEVPKLPTMSGVKARREQAATLTAHELVKLIEATEDEAKAAIALASWCCLRYGEVAALQRKHIDTDEWTVTVERAVKRDSDGSPVFGPPKSAAGYRTVSVPPLVRDVILSHLETYTGPGPEALVFSRPGGWGGLYSDHTMRAYLNRACERAGLGKMRFHDLRHTGLTLYGQAGATLADLMYRAGHASVDTVLIYQHSTAVRDRELAARMAG